MQETLSKNIEVVKPIAGMTQMVEPLSIQDSEFTLMSGTYPKQIGVQARMLGKTAINKFASSVLSIVDFLGSRIIQTSNDGLIKEDETGAFATLQIAANTQSKNRDSFAVSTGVQLCVRANGEERTKVIDKNGNVFNAEIPTPAAAPGLVVSAGGTLAASKFYAYAYVYGASLAYPFVERTNAINGHIYPRGQPSIASVATTTGTNKTITVNFTAPVRADTDTTWIFRSQPYATSAEATNAGAAGLLFYLTEIAAPTATFVDNGTAVLSVDQIEKDNYPASSFKSVIFNDPYWIGFGADIFHEQVTWVGGTFLLTLSTAKIYPGRGPINNFITFTLSGITTGGFDGKGTFSLIYNSTTTITSTQVLPAFPGGTVYITISPATANIYRSKERDPFAWGWTRTIGTLQSALEWACNVGGGVGTAIATIPNESILKVDTEFPTKCYGFDTTVIDDLDQFKRTQKTISEIFSTSTQGSQFPAQTKTGDTVLWSMDYKNFAILQSNGVTQVPISGAVQLLLRSLTGVQTDQVFCHGIYDAYTQCNCMWVTYNQSAGRVGLMIYQHAPSGYWGIVQDLDVLCSARVQDLTTGQRKIYVGTETGLYGQAFIPNLYKNWGAGNPNTGTVVSATNVSITCAAATFTVVLGLVGSWVYLTDANDGSEQWARISAATTTTLTFDRTYMGTIRFATLQIVPAAGWKFYLGLIECRALKHFDFKAPATDKKVEEMWLTQENATRSLVRLYREWSGITWDQIIPLADSYPDASLQTSFIEKVIISERVKSFGLEIINREYLGWVLHNLIVKAQIIP